MSNIQKTLDLLQPYVIGIRYVEGTPVIDAVFKDGWTIPEDQKIKKLKGNDEVNYYMIYSEADGVGLDELLGFINTIIKLNIEREKKHELLKVKVSELKDVFRKNSLSKLQTLKFTLGEEDLITKLTDIDLDETDNLPSNITTPQTDVIMDESEKEKLKEVIAPKNTPLLDADKKPIPLTEEDIEAAEEEARAEAFLKLQRAKKINGEVKKVNVELPPKKLVQPIVNRESVTSNCNCGPNEACSKCIENKDL